MVKKKTLASTNPGIYDHRGDTLKKENVEYTFQTTLDANQDYYLVQHIESMDLNQLPVSIYFYHSEGRDYEFILYSDGSWLIGED